MATTSSPKITSDARESKSNHSSSKRLWQVPVFLVGVAALFAVWHYRPLWTDHPARQIERDLSAVRRLLANPESDVEEEVRIAERAVETSEQVEDRAGEAYFLLGSAQIMLAERAAPCDAWQHWGPALMNLEQADKKGVPEADQHVLLYRLGKAGFHAKDDPKRVVERLAAAADQIERPAVPGDRLEPPGEAYSLLTQAYLCLQPPDVEAALAANSKLRKYVAGVREEVLAPARLLSAELNLRLHRVEKAREDLQRINVLAPPDIQLRARLLLAHSFQEEGRYATAAGLLQALLDEKSVPPAEANGIRYQLGFCYNQLKQHDEAALLWEECLRGTGGEEVSAAAVALAELRLHGPNPETASEALSLVAQQVQGPADWRNSLIDVEKVRHVFEDAVQLYRKAGKSDLALKAAGAYQKFAVAPRSAVLQAEVATDWARTLRNQARQAQPAESPKVEEDEGVRALFIRAGDSYGEAADLTRPTLEHADYLYLSGVRYLEGQDFAKAIDRLEQARKLEETAQGTLEAAKKVERQARLGELWYHLGDAHRLRKERELASADLAGSRGQLKEWEVSLAAYSECIKYPTPYAFKARYHLALMQMEIVQLDNARDNLQHNVQLLRKEPEPDTAVLEKSLFALGDILHRQRNYNEAISRFEDALQMARRRNEAGPRSAPTTEATAARYHLADSYLQLYLKLSRDSAESNLTQENQEHWKQQARVALGKADESFRDLEQFLKSPEGKDDLTEAERLEVALSMADCQSYLRNYAAALTLYEEQIKRIWKELKAQPNLGPRQRPQCEYLLQALSRSVNNYAYHAKRMDYARLRLADIKNVLQMSEPALTKEHFEEWKKWLEGLESTMKDADASK